MAKPRGVAKSGSVGYASIGSSRANEAAPRVSAGAAFLTCVSFFQVQNLKIAKAQSYVLFIDV